MFMSSNMFLVYWSLTNMEGKLSKLKEAQHCWLQHCRKKLHCHLVAVGVITERKAHALE